MVKNMKILLVNPMFPFAPVKLHRKNTPINLGILYIASMLIEKGHEVKVTISNSIDFLATLKKFNPNVVAFSICIQQYPLGLELSKQVKRFNKDCKVIMGGYFPTFSYDYILNNNPYVDFLVIGEGEETSCELINHLETNKRNLLNIKGIAFKKGNKIIFTGHRPLIQNLDSLPMPARYLTKKKMPFILASRGCYYNCNHCFIKNFYGRKIRRRSLDCIINEIKIMKEKDYKEIAFFDDIFFDDYSRMLKFCELIRKNNLNKLSFKVASKLEFILEHSGILKELNGVNFSDISFGIPTLSSVDEFNSKHLAQLKKLKKIIKDNPQVKFILFYIINNLQPKETKESILYGMNTILNLFSKLKNVYIGPFILTPLSGNDIYCKVRERIKMSEDWIKYDFDHCTYDYNNLKGRGIEKLFDKFDKELIRNKLYPSFTMIHLPFFKIFYFIFNFFTCSFSTKAKSLIIIDMINVFIKNIFKHKKDKIQLREYMLRKYYF